MSQVADNVMRSVALQADSNYHVFFKKQELAFAFFQVFLVDA